MIIKKRFFFPAILLLAGAAALYALIYVGEIRGLEATIARQQTQIDRSDSLEQRQTLLLRADSLFHAGQYSSAIDAYRQLDDSTTQSRIDHARRLNRLYVLLDTLQRERPERIVIQELAPIQTALPQPVRQLPLETSKPETFDSLTFALERANLRIRNLERRVSNNSGGNYLTFKSPKGNEIYYVGAVRNGKANGAGIALLSTGSRYEGDWQDNQKHGTGKFFWTDGARYEGGYQRDQRHGTGSYKFPDGSKYVGEWERDVRHGKGKFYNKKGELVTEGVWRNDELE